VTVRDWVAWHDPEMMLLEGEEFDRAIVGIVTAGGMEDRVLYDQGLVIQVLQDHHGMDADEAVEWFDHNIACAYVGDRTPAFMERP